MSEHPSHQPAEPSPIGTPGGTPERPAVFFADAAEFRAWLEQHHETATELWMGLRRAGETPRGLTWAQAVPEALCFGWIDSVSQPIDDTSRRQRWTPRTPRSTWSAVNVAHVERLTAEGRMHPAGIAAFERRTDARTAVYSHENPVGFTSAHQALLDAHPAAAAFWAEATPSYRRAAAHWVGSAKREQTRDARMQTLLDDCAAGRLVPPLRPSRVPAWLTRAAAAASAAQA